MRNACTAWTLCTHAQVDPGSGQTYYVNEKTKSSSWEKPAAPGGAPAAQVPASKALPPGWSVGTDPTSGHTYWFNETTKASQWTAP